jgi:hypothetical protein
MFLVKVNGMPLKLALAEEEIEDVFALSNLTDTDIDSLNSQV